MAWRHPRPARRAERLSRPPQRHRSAGFLLPLAALTSLLLLLGSLSVQAVSLQGRLRGETERQLQTAEDRLSSAAQLLIARIQLRHACLLVLPLEQWPAADCATASQLEQLRRGTVLDASWRLLRWHPEGTSPPAAAANPMEASATLAAAPATASPQPARLTLELALSGQERQPDRRAGFALQLQGPPWRVLELRPLGLRGGTP